MVTTGALVMSGDGVAVTDQVAFHDIGDGGIVVNDDDAARLVKVGHHGVPYSLWLVPHSMQRSLVTRYDPVPVPGQQTGLIG